MNLDPSFPDTHRTWIVDRLREGANGAAGLRCRLMDIYLEPLRHTCRARLGLSAEAALDLVHGFFASRLARADYLVAWQPSGKRLRLWLWNGLCFFAREEHKRDRRMSMFADVPEQIDERAPDPGRELERSFTVAIVRAALATAATQCRADGFAEHWEVFIRWHSGGQSLSSVAQSLGLPVQRALVMMRAPRRRLVEALAEVLIADGVRREEVPRAISELLEANEG